MEIFAEVLVDTLTLIMSEAFSSSDSVVKSGESVAYFAENDVKNPDVH